MKDFNPFCSKCGNENPADANFCMNCRANLKEESVEISPKIVVSPNINVSMIDKEQISLLLKDTLSKALEKAYSFKDIQAKGVTAEEQQAKAILLEIVEEADRRKGTVTIPKYNPQDLERCVKFLDTVLEKCSENFDNKSKEVFWLFRVVPLTGLGKHSEALDCWDKLLDIHPRNDAWWSNKGKILEMLNRYNEADCCVNKALEINPRSANALYLKGTAKLDSAENLINLKDFTIKKEKLSEFKSRLWIVMDFFDKALEIDPNYAEALKQRKVLLKELRKVP